MTIGFSEVMDPTTADGNVTLSSGTITDMTWTNPIELQITQTGWDDGVAVTVTVSTGLELNSVFNATTFMPPR